MKPFRFIKLITLKAKNPSYKARDENDVEMNTIYFGIHHIVGIFTPDVNDALPLQKSVLITTVGGYCCIDSVDEIVNHIESINYAKE